MTTPTGTPSVSLRGLTKVFGGSAVVDDLTLDIASGEFVWDERVCRLPSPDDRRSCAATHGAS